MSDPPLTSLAAAALHVPAPERALVIGCGEGEAVLLLAREFPAARIRGVDPSQTLVGKATHRVGLDPEGRVAFKVGKPNALPYPDEFFDLLVQMGGRPAPAEIARVLRPAGHLILDRSRKRRVARAARQGLLHRRLARRGFIPVQVGNAVDGNFFVARLGERD